MAALIGEYECRLDEKARLMLPSGLKKQVPAKDLKRFVINRGFEKHLNLYTGKEWDKITEEIGKLNLYVQKNREFVRWFNNGATELELDTSNRVLIPKSLSAYAGINKDVVLFAHTNRIEVWSKTEYDKVMKQGGVDFAKLAEDVMGNKPNDKSDVS
jgi:MraZ protein